MAENKALKKLIAPSKIWETIYDLSYLAGNDKLVETPYYDNDSRELYGDIQMWAIEFEKKFNIDYKKCLQCGNCIDVCPNKAIDEL